MSLVGGILSNFINAPSTQKAAGDLLSQALAGNTGVVPPGGVLGAGGSATIGGVTITAGSSGSSSTKTDWILYVVIGGILLVLLIASLFTRKRKK